MNRMPPAEGLLPRDRFPLAAAMKAAREEHPGKTFRDCPHCPEMVVVPAGRFEMGAGAAEHERFAVPPRTAEHEQPQHAVTIAKPFALAKFEVTRGEFKPLSRPPITWLPKVAWFWSTGGRPRGRI